MRVLIVKLSSFGDVIHTLPAISDLADARPGIAIDWLVEEGFAGMAAAHPAVRAAIPVGQRRLRWPPGRWPALVVAVAGLRRRLRATRYDLVIDLQGLMKSAVLARRAGAPVAGFDRASAREPVAARFYSRRIAVDRSLHAIERSRRLLAAAVGYDVPSTPPRFRLREGIGPLPADIPLPQRFAVAFHAASWATKLWPEEHWRAFLARTAGEPILLPWGTEAERARANRLAENIPGAMPLPRRLPVGELAAVLAGAAWAIGPDTGAMHLAAALDVPGVWLFGPTDPGLTGPVGAGQTILRSAHDLAPCRRRRCTDMPDGLCCMRAITVDAAVAAVAGLS